MHYIVKNRIDPELLAQPGPQAVCVAWYPSGSMTIAANCPEVPGDRA